MQSWLPAMQVTKMDPDGAVLPTARPESERYSLAGVKKWVWCIYVVRLYPFNVITIMSGCFLGWVLPVIDFSKGLYWSSFPIFWIRWGIPKHIEKYGAEEFVGKLDGLLAFAADGVSLVEDGGDAFLFCRLEGRARTPFDKPLEIPPPWRHESLSIFVVPIGLCKNRKTYFGKALCLNRKSEYVLVDCRHFRMGNDSSTKLVLPVSPHL